MPKFLILWEIDPTFTPKTPEERLKLWLTMLNMVKTDLQAGALKEWGVDVGGGSGYGTNDLSEPELYSTLIEWQPYVNFKVIPMLTVGQVIEAIKKLAQK